MIPVEQLHLVTPWRDPDAEPGDCMRACVASLLEVPADHFPNWVAYQGPGAHWDAMRSSLRAEGIDICCIDSFDQVTRWGEPAYAVASVPSPRGPWHHCVIVDPDGIIVHDPYPTDKLTGLAAADQFYLLVEPFDPFPDAIADRDDLQAAG